MKINRKKLIEAAVAVKPFCATSQTSPDTFKHIVIDPAAGIVSATDGQVSASTKVEFEDPGNDRFCVRPKALIGILKSITEDNVEIRINETSTNLDGSTDVHSIAIGAEFKTLVCQPISEYPDVAPCEITKEAGSVSGKEIGALALVRGVKDDMRDHIQNAFFDASNGNILSTDIKRLHMYGTNLDLETSAYVPKEILATMQQYETVHVAYAKNNQMCLHAGDLYVWFPLDDEPPQFFQYDELFQDREPVLSISKQEVGQVIEKARQLHDGRQHLTITIDPDGKCGFSLVNPEQGEMSQELPFTVEAGAIEDAIEIHVNPIYLHDAIRSASDPFQVFLPEQGQPVLIRGKGSAYQAIVAQAVS
jgi:DNA polymerase III sliding clamp (beta) subunit (PCNA family)